jgi:seryl-tRNA synthetase
MTTSSFAPNPLKGAFKVCAFDGCGKAKSPLGDLGVIWDVMRIIIKFCFFRGLKNKIYYLCTHIQNKQIMLTLKVITENTQEVIDKLAIKHYDAKSVINEVIETDKIRKSTQKELDGNLASLNLASKSIGQFIKEGNKSAAESARNKVTVIKEGNKRLETSLKEAENKLTELLLQIPNLPSDTVPKGKHAEDNVVEKMGGTIPDLYDGAQPHWDLASKYDLIDFELGVKISGAGFPVYKQKGAQLQRALINFFLDNAREAGYIEIQPPYVVNADSGYGTGQLPDKEGQMYHCQIDDLYLIPTAEVPVTNIYRDVILEEKDLPLKNAAYSACFRREAGSYGKDVRGLNRLHQFDKVEIVRIDTPEHSYQSLQEMVDYVQTLLDKLELPWRILRLCGGDMSFTSALTFDFEVFSAAQQRWLEVSSVSNFESYQANRLKCRYRNAERKIQLCHTLNGSALAIPRIVAALLENNQTPEGIKIPKELVPYTRFDLIS